MLRSFLRWLDRAPIEDPVDRRNARVIQLLLLFLGVTIPATLAFAVIVAWSQLVSSEVHWSTHASLAMSLSIGAAAWIGLVLTRRGAFAAAVKLLIGAMLLVTTINLGVNLSLIHI